MSQKAKLMLKQANEIGGGLAGQFVNNLNNAESLGSAIGDLIDHFTLLQECFVVGPVMRGTVVGAVRAGLEARGCPSKYARNVSEVLAAYSKGCNW